MENLYNLYQSASETGNVGNLARRIQGLATRLLAPRLAGLLLFCSLVLNPAPTPAFAADATSSSEIPAASMSAIPVTPRLEDVTRATNANQLSLNLAWILVAAFLVTFMQAGFALLESGLCRAKCAAYVATMNLMIYGLGTVAFWAFGFAFMFGGYANAPTPIGWHPVLGDGLRALDHEWAPVIFGHPMGLIGCKGFFLNPTLFAAAVFALFLFQLVFVNICATIPTGAMAERWSFKNFMLYGLWVGALPIAIFGNWIWGGGWLAQLGQNFGLGHGVVDFAGSTVVHMCGGVIGLVGAFVLGPRLGKYGPNGRPRPIPGHNLVYVVIGTFILAFGWFGMNSGSAFGLAEGHAAVVAVNTMLAGATGALAAYFTMMFKFGKPDPSILCNGLLAGLVAICASCAFVSPVGAFVIGTVAGVLAVHAVIFMEGSLRVDDPVGAVSVHGISGAWGALSVGLFANGSFGAGWGGVHRLVKGGEVFTLVNDGTAAAVAKYREMIGAGWADVGVTGVLGRLFGAPLSDWSQLAAQCVGVLTCFVFVGAFAFGWFKLSNAVVRMRSRRENEIAGLDLQELGAECYPDYQLTDKSSPRVT